MSDTNDYRGDDKITIQAIRREMTPSTKLSEEMTLNIRVTSNKHFYTLLCPEMTPCLKLSQEGADFHSDFVMMVGWQQHARGGGYWMVERANCFETMMAMMAMMAMVMMMACQHAREGGQRMEE